MRHRSLAGSNDFIWPVKIASRARRSFSLVGRPRPTWASCFLFAATDDALKNCRDAVLAVPLANLLDGILLFDLGNFLEGIFFLVFENLVKGILAMRLTWNGNHEKWPAAQRAASHFLKSKRSGKALCARAYVRPSVE